MVTTTHRIRKQQWLVSVATANDAFSIRKQIRERLGDTLEPVFNRTFDELSDKDQIIRIPRLELKLKVNNDAELWENLPQALYEQLTIQLQNVVNKGLDSQIAEFLTVNSIVSDQLHRFEILIHYLNHGDLPWQASQLSVNESLEELKVTIHDQMDQLIEYLTNNKPGEAVFFRLFHLFSPDRLLEFIERLLIIGTFSKHYDLKNFFRGLFESDGSTIGQHSRLSIAATLVSMSLHIGGRPTVTGLISEALGVLPEDKVIDLQKFIATLPEYSKLFPVEVPAPFNNFVLEGDKKRPSDWEENSEVQSTAQVKVNQETNLSKENFELVSSGQVQPEQGFYNAAPSDHIPNKGVPSEHVPSEHVTSKQELSDREFSKESPSEQVFSRQIHQPINNPERNINDLSANSLQGIEFSNADISSLLLATSLDSRRSGNKLQQTTKIWVKYAGLVIFHPFLQRLFVKTSILTEGEKNIPFHNLSKAAALLHFMATGNDEIYEFELGFIKVLIGLDPEESLLVSDGLITSLDKEESISLVQSVIGHWSVLKNTSVDGLRQTFIQRNALLNRSEMGWKLLVEPSAFDLLLNQLPWSFNIIKLPWMNKPIYTEWQIF